MHRDRLKRLRGLHAWTGILTGLFVYIVSFSGTIALFGEEIKAWESPFRELLIPANPIEFNQIIESAIAEQDNIAAVPLINARFPRPTAPYYEVFMRILHANGETVQFHHRWNAETGELLPERGNGLSYWLVHFHTQLMIEGKFGRVLVGMVGIVMTLSIMSGLVIYRKFLNQFFTWQIDRSSLIGWRDTHNAIGVWGLPFHAMIALTGAVLGIMTILLPLFVLFVGQGNQKTLMTTIGGPQLKPAGLAAPMLSLNRGRARVHEATGQTTNFAIIKDWGDRNATYDFFYEPEDELIRFGHVHMNAVTGNINDITLSENGVAGRVLASITPLHYGTYGGIWLKYLYGILGLLLCIMILSGLFLWIERRKKNELHAGQQIILLRLLSGISLGIIFATITLFYWDRLYSGNEEHRLYWTGICYFLSWFLVLFSMFLRAHTFTSVKQTLYVCAAGLIGIPILDVYTTGLFSTQWFSDSQIYGTGTDLVLLILGLAFLLSVNKRIMNHS